MSDVTFIFWNNKTVLPKAMLWVVLSWGAGAQWGTGLGSAVALEAEGAGQMHTATPGSRELPPPPQSPLTHKVNTQKAPEGDGSSVSAIIKSNLGPGVKVGAGARGPLVGTKGAEDLGCRKSGSSRSREPTLVNERGPRAGTLSPRGWEEPEPLWGTGREHPERGTGGRQMLGQQPQGLQCRPRAETLLGMEPALFLRVGPALGRWRSTSVLHEALWAPCGHPEVSGPTSALKGQRPPGVRPLGGVLGCVLGSPGRRNGPCEPGHSGRPGFSSLVTAQAQSGQPE